MKYRIVKNGLEEYAIEQRIFPFLWVQVSDEFNTQEEAEKCMAGFKWLDANDKKANTWEVV